MGITDLSLKRLNEHIRSDDNILMLGCQNLYNAENYGQIADEYFSMQGYTIRTIDICGCQGSEIADLREDLEFSDDYSLILQHGTVEHCDSKNLYQPFKNIHEALQVGGIVIHENPKTGNWAGHGYHYFTKKFYVELAKLCKYELLEVIEEPAMGNTETGMNVCAVLRKTKDSEFITGAQFEKLDIRKE